MKVNKDIVALKSARLKVLLLCPAPLGRMPSQRFRFEQYLEVLNRSGIEIEVAPFLELAALSILYKGGSHFRKVASVMQGFYNRLKLASRFRKYDRIFLSREAAPIGPPMIEWLAVRSGTPLVYDIDDAIFIRNVSRANRMIGWLKFPSKVNYIAKKSARVVVCNQYLFEWASQLNPNTLIVPTTVDLDYHHSSRDRAEIGKLPVIGWTGSHSTTPYLDLIRPALESLQNQFEFEFRVICDKDPGFPQLRNYRFVPWRAESEIADLDGFDIGVMPVPDGPWERGKVGFKAIQYGAMEIPSVVSMTGSGAEVVNDGVTGLVVENTTEAWVRALQELLSNRSKAASMGQAARLHIASKYSTAAQAAAYIRVFKGEP